MSAAPDVVEKTKRWLVLLVQSGEPVKTEDPRVETFYSEKEAIAYAKESCREDTDPDAVYHVMKTTHTVQAHRHVSVKVLSIR